MRLATVLTLGALVVTAGCGHAEPQNLQPVVAVYGCYTMLTAPVSPDRPVTPDGKVICDNCGGPPGRVGDGTVSVDCPVCDGGYVLPDEQAVKHEPIAVPLDKLPAVAPPAKATSRSTSRANCPDGKCNIRR